MSSGVYIRTESYRKIMSEAMKGRVVSEVTKQKLRQRTPWMKGKHHTEEHKRRLSILAKERGFGKWMLGKRMPIEKRKSRWKLKYREREEFTMLFSDEYRYWRKAVFERDNYQCVFGGKEHGNDLIADHIKPFAFFPELRLVVSNGRTLCRKCHYKTDSYGSKARKNYLQHEKTNREKAKARHSHKD